MSGMKEEPKRHSASQPTRRAGLVNGVGLAAAMNVSRTYVQAMKKEGYKFTHGNLTTVESGLEWKAAHPDFVIRSVYQKKRKAKTALAHAA